MKDCEKQGGGVRAGKPAGRVALEHDAVGWKEFRADDADDTSTIDPCLQPGTKA